MRDERFDDLVWIEGRAPLPRLTPLPPIMFARYEGHGSRCWADDCDGCGCGHPGAHPPCSHCTDHGIDVEPCDRCGCDTCGCTEERVELRQRARDFPWLVP